MDHIQQGLVALMKSAVTGERIDLPAGFDMEQAYSRIARHHMAALIYAGAVNCGVSPALPVMQRLFQTYCKALQVSERQLRALDKVFRAFDENQIDYLPLKGCLMKPLYPKPEMRLMGDADVLIRPEQYEQISGLMKKLGFEDDHGSHVHYNWHSQALNLELHIQLMPDNFAHYGDYFRGGWVLAQPVQGTRYAMNAEDTFLFLLVHFAKHYSLAGVGCRHLLDLWVYLRHHPQMDETYLTAALKQTGLLAFYGNVHRLLAAWFEGETMDVKAECIAQYVFASGSWGTARNGVLSRGVRDMGASESVSRSRLKYIWRGFFPQWKDMKQQYPVLKKLPWLLPVMWARRLCGKLAGGVAFCKKHIQRVRMLKPDALETHKQMLEYVGLNK